VGELSNLFEAREVRPATQIGKSLAPRFSQAVGMEAYPSSLTSAPGGIALLARDGLAKSLLIVAPEEAVPGWVGDFYGKRTVATIEGRRFVVLVSALSHENALALRSDFPYTAPRTFGLKTSAGLGDRLGVGTTGHIKAVRGTGIVPFLAQQSIREMTRTHRSAVEVMDDATWGVFQEGWGQGYGSDADHLKTTADIDATAAAGFTMFTIDPGDHVDNSADSASAADLRVKVENLDWSGLEASPKSLKRAYVKEIILADDIRIAADEGMFMRAVVKYGAAVAHTAAMYRHLVEKMGRKPFELEMSVDETQTPTSTFEHYFVAKELKRLGVKWVSLAPRFIGDFEKGIDYKGDLKAFEKSFAEHMAVVKKLGPYKISIHSGSDKFSIYPIIARLAEGYVHVKTAGTSYLEALHVLADVDPGLFREILDFAFARYNDDKRSYHVSADIDKVRRSSDLRDDELARVLDINDGRQLLHVTFGSVLTTKKGGEYLFRERLLKAMRLNEDKYYDALRKHLGRHIAPFVAR
jgi:tagaturonate epimerase